MNLNSSRLKLAYVVKYYYPMPRISGILRFVQDLIRELERDFSVRVFTSRYSRDIPAQEEYRRHQIQRLSAPFPLRAGAAVRRWRPDVIIFGSGFWRPYYLLPYWELFRLGAGKVEPARYSHPIYQHDRPSLPIDPSASAGAGQDHHHYRGPPGPMGTVLSG